MERRISVYLTNLNRYTNGMLCGEWVKLPIPEEELETVLHRIGTENDEFFITDYETLFGNLHISEYASIAELNKLAERIDGLADCDYDKLGAVLESENCMTIAGILEIIEELDSFDLLEGVDTDSEIGEYFADVGDLFHGIPDHIQRYFDFESYGRDIRLELNTCLTSYGLVIDNR